MSNHYHYFSPLIIINHVGVLVAVVIAGLQISIAVLGDFNGGQLEEYLPCVLEEYEATNRTLPVNSTFPVSYLSYDCMQLLTLYIIIVQ